MEKKEKKEAQPLDIGDDKIEIEASYNFDNPLWIKDPDPSMKYYFAADDGDRSRPDGVARVLQMGYKKSEKEHGSTDCQLLEMPLDRWKKMQAARRKHFSRDKEEEVHQAAEDKIKALGINPQLISPVRLDGGGIKRS